MKILVTGAGGFIGRNLTSALWNLQTQKDHTRPNLNIEQVFSYTSDCSEVELDYACTEADFVFHLAGVNRPDDPEEFLKGNGDFTDLLLRKLRGHGNFCPVMLASSVQASLVGRYEGSVYGISKRRAEELVYAHGRQNHSKTLVYRFPNVFGKWCKPNYNSVIATFCHNMANDLPIRIDDPEIQLELLYVDDLVQEMLDALEGNEHRCTYEGLQPFEMLDGPYCYCPVTHRVKLGEIARLLKRFCDQPTTLYMPSIPSGSFAKKLYSTYLSYLPKEKVAFSLKMNGDQRGSFTELLRTDSCGQFSVNISKPGITKGQHWHHTKWELFFVVAGHGLIQQRKIGSDEVLEFEVSGETIEAVHMLPGFTHNLINLSQTEDLVTVMWANESFDPERPDTYYEQVV